MKRTKKLVAVLMAMAMMITMIPATIFAEETAEEYATIVIENSDTAMVKTLEGTLLADTLETDQMGNYICKVGTTLNFTIEAKRGYELMVAYYGFENSEGGFGGTDIPMDETNTYYTILVDSVGTYTITPGTIASETEYTVIAFDIDEHTSIVALDGTPLEDTLQKDGDTYVCEVGTRLEFNILVDEGYKYEGVMKFVDGYSPDAGYGGGLDQAEDGNYYLDANEVGVYTIITEVEVDNSADGEGDEGTSDTPIEMSWEESLMSCFGISAGSNYFGAGESPSQSTIYTYINMNLDEYMDEDYYYNLTYDEYMAVVDKYFVNYVEMKDYLTQLGQYDAETDMVRIYSGGFGGGVSWELTSTYEATDGTYVLQGLCLVESTTAGNVYDSYEWDGATYYVNIEGAVELTVSSTVDGEWEIISFEQGFYYIYESELCGTTLQKIDENGQPTDDPFYPVTIEENEFVTFTFDGSYTFANNDNHWYSPNKDFYWTAVPKEGYTCQVMVEKLMEGEISTSYAATKGVIYGVGEVTLTPIPQALLTIEAEHAKVTIRQGLTDMGDGTYALEQGACVEVTVEVEDGYKVDSVMIGDYEAKLNSFGSYTAYPSFEPDKIVVKTSSVTVFKNTVTVVVPEGEVEKFEGLSLVTEELDEETEEEATAIIMENIDGDVEEVYILDIFFENADGEEVSVNANMTVEIPIPEGWDPARVAVYYVNPETGEVTDMNGVVSADGKTIVFVTTHFSNYALVQIAEETSQDEEISEGGGKAPVEGDKAPTTGDINSVLLWAGMMTVAGYAVVSMKKEKKSNLKR